jgi:hypothetical protein
MSRASSNGEAMTLSWELNATTLLLLAINLVGQIWFAFSTQATASAAHRKADHAHARIAALAEAESKFREKIFLEYVNRDILRELEARTRDRAPRAHLGGGDRPAGRPARRPERPAAARRQGMTM